MKDHLIDRLASATVTAPGEEYVAVQPITIGRQTRMSLFQHPPSCVEFAGVKLGRSPRLHLGCGIKEAAWEKIRSGVMFELTLTDRRGDDHLLFALIVDPVRRPVQRRWLDATLDLNRFAGQCVALRFETSIADGDDSSWCWSGWSDPHIQHETPAVVPRRRPDRHRHILLITADALRADYLGCYGHPTVRTPHLDQLAREGCLFEHARAPHTSTLGSYASMLTAQYSDEHGMVAEWGELRTELTNLPRYLMANGYHTLLAASEAELTLDRHGLPAWFAETIPCLALPAQAGSITARQFVRWLDRRPDQPFFAWVQFFDTHPPCTPPEPFRSMYYRGDPSDEAACHEPQKVGRIHGVESVLELELTLESLERGMFPPACLERFLATAEVLLGTRQSGPDLASHLLALGAEACNGLPPRSFGGWLRREVDRLREGIVSAELLRWLHELLPRLKAIEAEILSWIKGVVDFRYPLSLYQSQVSHLDHHVGSVVAALKERGLYEQTLIVVTSPHGEVLDERGLTMHHHALFESVLRVPLLVKPGGSPHCSQPGRRIGGVFDLVDLFPTLLDAANVALPVDVPGVSRWQHVFDGSAIPAHDSVAVEIHHCMVALARPPFVFLKALRDYPLTTGWDWQAGDTALFELCEPTRNLASVHPGIAASMEDRLNTWLSRRRYPCSATHSHKQVERLVA